MTINSNEKLDLLWKHFKGVAPTSNTKAPHNERYSSSSPTFQKNFWTDSDRIPQTAPLVDIPVGSELWVDIIAPHKGPNALQLIVDPTTDFRAFHAMENLDSGIVEENRVRNWVPATFDRTYSIRVWAGAPTGGTGSVRLAPNTEGYEWEFDYSNGILYFPNGVPAVAKQNGIWIEGWKYTGEIGREGSNGASNTSKIRTLSYTTGILAPGEFVDFTFETGGKVVLVEAKVTSAATLECHSVSTRDDTNPYRFMGVDGHLTDDGSYTIAGNRFYGERFVHLINMEDTTSSETYWRVYNTDVSARMITIIVRVA